MGAVKTRLAAGIGAVPAWRFYARTTADLLREVGDDPRWRLWLAVAPDRFALEGRFWPTVPDRLPQGPGDLGRRMNNVACSLPPGPVVIIGSDIPDITRDHIAAAFDRLKRHDIVFGPARDGGYWLIGLRRGPAPPSRFTAPLLNGIRWSTEHALEDTLKSFGARPRIAWLETLEDIDSPEDYVRWRAARALRRASLSVPR